MADFIMIGGNGASNGATANGKAFADNTVVEIKPYTGTTPSPQINPLLIILPIGIVAAAVIYFLAKKKKKDGKGN